MITNRPMNVFDIAGRAMSAQLVRLNTTASNLANAGSVSGDARRRLPGAAPGLPDRRGRARHRHRAGGHGRPRGRGADPAPRPNIRWPTGNGNVWEAGVDSAAELIDMVETARQYQNNVQVLQTAKTLTLDTLRLGQ